MQDLFYKFPSIHTSSPQREGAFSEKYEEIQNDFFRYRSKRRLFRDTMQLQISIHEVRFDPGFICVKEIFITGTLFQSTCRAIKKFLLLLKVRNKVYLCSSTWFRTGYKYRILLGGWGKQRAPKTDEKSSENRGKERRIPGSSTWSIPLEQP